MTTEALNPEKEIVQNDGGANAVVPIRRPQHQLANRDLVSGMLRPVAAPGEVLEAQNEVRELVAKALKKGRDYGVIRGTERATLLKPGAERINAAYGLAAEYHVTEEEIDHDREVQWTKRKKKWANKYHGDRDFTWEEESGVSLGLYRYVVECRLIHRASGVMVGQGLGSCSSMESKYIDRPRDTENTILKMAGKRALIAATLNTHGLSDQFTQDMEDFVEEGEDSGNGQSGGSTAANGSATRQGSQSSTSAPTCPECDGAMFDNRAENVERVKQGKKARPAFKCRQKECEGLYWDDPSEDTSATDATAELDRILAGAQTIVNEIKGVDAEIGDACQSLLDDHVKKDSVTADQLRKLGGKFRTRLNTLKEEAQGRSGSGERSKLRRSECGVSVPRRRRI